MEAAYYAFIFHGIFPGDFEQRPEREKLLMLAMIEQASEDTKGR